jgi:hypothetical protein
MTPTFTPTFTPTPAQTCKQESACLVFDYRGYTTDASGQTTITFRVTNKCKQTISYVAFGTDTFTRVSPASGSTYTGGLGTYAVTWTDTAGSPGFTGIEFQPKSRNFKNGASEMFRIVVTNFDPSVIIHVAGQVGTSPSETFDFLLKDTICEPGPTATPVPTNTPTLVVTNTPTQSVTNTPTATPTRKPTRTPKPH